MRIFASAKILITSATAGTLALAAVAPAVANDARAPLAESWHVSLQVTGAGGPAFSAVAATSGSSAWAFEFVGGKAPAAYKLSGSGWKRRAFPGGVNDLVTSASAASASNVWAFTFQGRVLRFNGTKWSTVKKFSRPIMSGLAISGTDVWVFGSPGVGTWHFNGHGWARSRSGKGLQGASALSAKNIWAYGGTSVAHWNGRTWTKTSLASLLPKNTQLSHSGLLGIYAAAPKSVYVIGSGQRQDEGGPLVLLHFNGSAWRKAGEVSSLGDPVAVIPDGHGGLWIPVGTGSPREASMEHYSHGTLSSVRLPVPSARLTLLGAAIGKNTTAALTVGVMRRSGGRLTAIILRFGP